MEKLTPSQFEQSSKDDINQQFLKELLKGIEDEREQLIKEVVPIKYNHIMRTKQGLIFALNGGKIFSLNKLAPYLGKRE